MTTRNKTKSHGTIPDVLGDPAKRSPRSVFEDHTRYIDKASDFVKTEVDDDALLDELLDDDSLRDKKVLKTQKSKYITSTEDSGSAFGRTLETQNDDIGMAEYQHFERVRYEEERKERPFSHIRFEEQKPKTAGKQVKNSVLYNKYMNDESSGSSGSTSVASIDSAETNDLLHRAHDRLYLQQLQDEVTDLKQVIERKKAELENLGGQLRRAVATKCDLVLAHTELERHHEFNLRRRDQGIIQLKRENLSILEAQSEMEKELLNEIVKVTEQLKDAEQRHLQELDDRDRCYRNEIAEKDFQIAKLKEEIRRLRHNSSTSAPGLSVFNFTSLMKKTSL